MTREEALEVIKSHPFLFASFPDDVLEALDVLIKLEQEPQTFKWCTDCREYDQEKHCCHRWSKVIRDTVEEMKQEPVLDKIRDAIDLETRVQVKHYTNTDAVIDAVLDIIDKYKAESEDKE